MSRFGFRFEIFQIVIFITLIAVSGFFAFFVPLTNVIGYEYSVVTAVLTSFLGGLLFIHLARSSKHSNFKSIFSQNAVLLIVFIFTPLFIALMSFFILRICPISGGIYFYPVITMVSFFYGLALGYFSFSVNERFSYFIFTGLFFIAVFLWSLEIYFNPQIYFYNSIIGFYPGTIYDEDISVTVKLVEYRIWILLFSILLILLAEVQQKSNLFTKSGIIFLTIVIAGGFYFTKPYLNFSTDLTGIKEELRITVITPNFKLHFPESIDRKNIERISFLHEFYYAMLKEEIQPRENPVIESFIFKRGEQKRRIFGASSADVTIPWRNQIFINMNEIESVLKHELVHVFSAEFGVTPFKLSDKFNPALLEGFASAIENNYDGYEIHALAAIAYKNGFAISLKSFFQNFSFFARSSSISYIYAGSFIKYLKDLYGIEKIKQLYGNLNFEQVFNRKIEELEKRYFDFLEKYPVPRNENIAKYYFGRKSIFKKHCVRYTANQLKKAWELYRKGAYFSSGELFNEIYNKSFSASALLGWANSLRKQGEYLLAENVLLENIRNFENSASFYSLELNLADVLFLNKKFDKADSLYKSLFKQNPRLNYRALADLRLKLLSKGKGILKKYLTGSELDKYEILKSMYEKYRFNSFLPSLIILAKNLNKNYDDFITYLNKNKLKSNNTDIFTYVLMKLGEYSFGYYDFANSLKFLRRAQNSKGLKYFKNHIIERIDAINWINSNKEFLYNGLEIKYYK